jgi:alkaline phosphatase D
MTSSIFCICQAAYLKSHVGVEAHLFRLSLECPRPTGHNVQVRSQGLVHRDWSGNYYSESWDSYSATRDRILKHITQNSVRNPVVLSGDMHSAWASNLESNFFDKLNSDVIGTEFVSTSMSSGLSSGWDTTYKNARPYNKHVKYYDGRPGGYLLCTIDKYNWKSEYLLAQSRTNDQSSLSTIATWYVHAGRAGLQTAPK